MRNLRTCMCLLQVTLFVSLLRNTQSSFSVDSDSVLIQENLANFKKFIADIRSPPVFDQSEDLRADVLVTIKNGTLQGKTALTGIGGKRFYSYTKVPYAKAPVGELRFEPPQPPEGWGDRIYNARVNSPACAQFFTAISLPYSEDCLFLNIHTPRPGNSTREKLLPVMVFIHGGAFVLGEASLYGAEKLMKTDNEVIFIAMQYRLGAFGFMSTGNSVLPGNMGMKDQVQALRWIQENIEAFGGDKNKVTVFGESAGAGSSIYMLISPLAKGLFSKVIAMSGTAIAEWAIDRNPLKSTQRLAGQLGCPNDTSTTELVLCMKRAPMMKIAYFGTINSIEDMGSLRVELPGSSPVIEGDVPGAFLTDDPLKLLSEGPLPNVPVMMGAVQNEGTLPIAGFYFLTLERFNYIRDPIYMREQLLGDLMAAYGVDDHRGGSVLSQSVALAFLPDSDRTDFDEMVYQLIDLLSVLFMKAPIGRTVEILSRRIPSNVYLYSFEHYGTSSLYHLLAGGAPIIIPGSRFPNIRPGIMHADDLMYMFPFPLIQNAADRDFGKIFCELWTNFATYGTPTPQRTARYPLWPPFTIATQNYLQLKLKSEVKSVYSKSWRQGVPQ